MATYINAKLRKAIESNDTRTINRELFPLFRADNPDYKIGVSDPAIYRQWVKEFIATATTTAKPEPKTAKSTEKPKTAGRKTKTETETAPRDKEEPKPKSKTKSKSRNKKAEAETIPEIDTKKVIAKLKSDYVSGRISAECFANAISALANI